MNWASFLVVWTSYDLICWAFAWRAFRAYTAMAVRMATIAGQVAELKALVVLQEKQIAMMRGRLQGLGEKV